MTAKHTSTKRHLLRWTTWTMLSLLIGCAAYISIKSGEFVQKGINNYLADATGNDYRLTFSGIQANLFTQSVSLDSVRLESLKKEGTHYRFTSLSLRAGGISIRALLLNHKLTVNKLTLVEPALETYSPDGRIQSETDKNDLKRKLGPFFGNRLKSLSINEIKLHHAKVSHYNLTENAVLPDSLSNFDIGIDHFFIDPVTLARHEELFRAEEIYFRIGNLKRMLGDSLHRLSVDELTYSVRKNNITGKNIRLEPVDSSGVPGTRYWIEVPEVRLKSGNLRNVLVNDTIRIDSLILRKSDIRIRPSANNDGLNLRKIKEYDLYQLIRNDFKQVNISHLSFEGEKMRIEPRTQTENSFQEFRRLKVEVDQFRLDSTSGREPAKILYSNVVSLHIEAYLLQLKDGVHRFEAENISASSQDSLIRADNLRLMPMTNNHKLPASVQLHCDSIRLLSVDLARLFHQREMPLQEVAAFKPELKLQQWHNPTDKNRNNNSLLYHFIGDYIKGVYANVVAIEHGFFQVDDLRSKADTGIVTANFDFRLTDFSLDSVSARRTDKLFFATNLELSFRDYQMKLADQLHQLKIEEITVSSQQKQAAIKKLQLFPDENQNTEALMKQLNRSERYRINIPQLQLRNTDIHHAFFNKRLNINIFSIVQPEIYFEVFANPRRGEKEFNPEEFYELLNNYIAHIEINKIDLSNGKIRLVSHSKKGRTIDLTNKFNLELDHFVLNDEELKKDRLLFADHFDLSIKDHLFKLSDNVHFLQASEISISSRTSNVLITKALLYPDITSPDYMKLPWHIQVSAPRISLKNVDLHQAYFNQILDVEYFKLNAPVVEIYRNSNGKGKFNFSDISVPLPEEMKELNVQQVAMNKGLLKIYNMDGFQKNQTVNATVDFEVEQANLKRPANDKTARFTSSNIKTLISRLHLTPEKVAYTMDVESISYSSADKQLTFAGLDIRSNRENDRLALAGISMPLLRFNGLDPTEAFQHNRFHAEQIRMSQPIFKLNVTETKRSNNPLFIKLPPDLQMVMDELSAREVSVDGATFIIQNKGEITRHDQVDLKLEQFRLDSTLSEKTLGAENLEIVKNNHHFSDKKKRYNLVVDRIAYTGNKQQLTFSGIHIQPKYSRESFQQAIRFQTDYYSGDIDQLAFTGIDTDRWFAKREFTGNQILVHGARVDIYRDKRTPFNEKQRPPLPQELIKTFDLPFYFDSVKLIGSEVSYAEQLEGMPAPGYVKFTRLNMRLHPFTNLTYLRNLSPTLRMAASARLMNVSDLNVNMTFNMNLPNYPFTATGSLSPFDMTVLNPITENNASILVRSGQLNRFDFEFSADAEKANGKLRFAYDDLKIAILEQKDGDTKEAKFASFLANSLMLKSKNPRTRFLLPDDIYFRRDQKRSIINYWWKTIFSGAKNTFGIKDEKE
ncbi:hypothetical protein [Gaoshiqia sediminis]|uniref:DUF748 domain-containing protein n=1 Tax=Gaoshiqia sediminis TaxID=2986998 RepID=A0AA42C8N1_9BACT|nr:hypothetical protein [Gaoshiqia sediminis]MCW0482911.1 hypothetical protein [Gaoshiqia sediminis]